jgi:hypothetical protein
MPPPGPDDPAGLLPVWLSLSGCVLEEPIPDAPEEPPPNVPLWPDEPLMPEPLCPPVLEPETVPPVPVLLDEPVEPGSAEPDGWALDPL